MVRPAIEPSAAQRAAAAAWLSAVPEFSENRPEPDGRDARRAPAPGAQLVVAAAAANWADRGCVVTRCSRPSTSSGWTASRARRARRPSGQGHGRPAQHFLRCGGGARRAAYKTPADFETEHVVLRRECEAEAKPLLARFIRGNQSSARGSLMTPARLAEPATHAPGPAGAPLALASARELLVPIDADRPPLGARTLPCMTARS